MRPRASRLDYGRVAPGAVQPASAAAATARVRGHGGSRAVVFAGDDDDLGGGGAAPCIYATIYVKITSRGADASSGWAPHRPSSAAGGPVEVEPAKPPRP